MLESYPSILRNNPQSNSDKSVYSYLYAISL